MGLPLLVVACCVTRAALASLQDCSRPDEGGAAMVVGGRGLVGVGGRKIRLQFLR